MFIRKKYTLLIEHLFTITHGQGTKIDQPGNLFNLGEFRLEQGAKRRRDRTEVQALGAGFRISEYPGHPVNAVRMFMVPVETQFMPDVVEDQQASGKPGGQAKQVDEGYEFIPHQVAPGDFEIVVKHDIVSQLVS